MNIVWARLVVIGLICPITWCFLDNSNPDECPKWTVFYEVANTTRDCNQAKAPVMMMSGKFCQHICAEVITNCFCHFALKMWAF